MFKQNDSIELDVGKINFHPALKDIENIFWFFLISMRALSDYDIQNILRTKDSQQEGYGMFVEILKRFNSSTNLKILKNNGKATSKMNIAKEMIFMGKAMAIMTYDLLNLSKYNNEINKNIEFQFLRHVRNGAAHNNKFNLKDEKGEWKIGEDEVIEWNEMKISRELQGRIEFNEFISVFGIFLLAKHFSEKLIKIDKKNNEK